MELGVHQQDLAFYQNKAFSEIEADVPPGAPNAQNGNWYRFLHSEHVPV
jgi:hypothetical protein